ncbi:MAG: hypothetical protein HYY45_08210, partial [Deltaproteobacteria bacterium]|nr:hypothetical protein [Deltaproteobacteria bacterium]
AFLAKGYFGTLRTAIREGTPLFTILTYIGYVEKYALLAALFTQFDIKVHLYNSYPQGKVAWRHDSGLVTGACRRHGVHSLTYQTRAHFGWAVELCFDCYDTYCVWGEWWKTCYQERMFVKNFRFIGSVFVDEYEMSSSFVTGQLPSEAIKTVMLFPCDIHWEGEPSYLTLDYAVQFLSAAIRAVSRLNRRVGFPYYRVVIKPKHVRHIDVFQQHPALCALLRDEGVEVTYLAKAISDVKEAIERADYVLALLPTTPGMDALLLGKPSAYFNTLRQGDPVFDEHPIIVRDEDEIEQFLKGRRAVDNGLLNRFDPYRDGRARERLWKVIRTVDQGQQWDFPESTAPLASHG